MIKPFCGSTKCDEDCFKYNLNIEIDKDEHDLGQHFMKIIRLKAGIWF
jgi:hypothetical protein